MSSKSYLVSSPTSHKSISPGSLLLSSRGVAPGGLPARGACRPTTLGPVRSHTAWPHGAPGRPRRAALSSPRRAARLAARDAPRSGRSGQRPCPPHAALRPAQQLLCPHRPAARSAQQLPCLRFQRRTGEVERIR